MPPARWSCSNCGIVNKPSNTQCYGCATKCPVFDVETWTCPDCQRPVTAPTCPGCQYRQPLSKEGVPQIFEGVKCAFTGIIPRSLPHWSLWKEWQLAEQRGARPLNEITTRCTHLIFKEGFERSDKVRKARNMACNMKIVCSEWFYQSVALGVRLDEDPYTLSNPQTKLVASSVQGASKDIARIYQDQLSEIAAVTYSDGGKVLKMRPSQALTPEGDFMWLVPPQQTQPLFQDCTLVFSPSVDAKLKGLSRSYSAKESSSVATADSTHFVVAPEDVKPHIDQVKEAAAKGLSVVTAEWLRHCVQLQELLPGAGPYEIPVSA